MTQLDRQLTRVVVAEINVYENMFPLVCGYLQSYAMKDPAIRENYEFSSLVATRKESIEEIAEALVERAGDIYAFSCYVWNMGVVKALMPIIAARMPDVRFIMGGPQVMNHADRYIDPTLPETIVCNGEGELPFSGILREWLEPTPDFTRVGSVSFLQGGSVVSTETEPRITELDEIPSPYLANLFDGDYRMAVIETNRGCPYSCGFCYWGAANNSRIHRFDEQRIRDEITWISEHGIPIVYIADANWGILKRDVGLSEHFVECKEKNAHPLAVIFSTAKNKPERVSEITKHFGDHGMISTQTISMQSLDETALDRIDRKNIKLSNFAEVQADLNKNGIGSYIELIWPLPGETLTSFKQGLQTLCERDASTVIVYAHMLLHNTPVWEAQAEHGIETHVVMDDSAEMEMVVRTNEVSREEYDDGLWFIYAMSALHNCRTLQTLDAYLFQVGITDYQTIFTEFGEFLRDEKGFALSEFCHDSVRTARFYEFTNFPTLYHLVMHEDRVGFANLLRRYLESKSWWADENVQFLFELDMVLRPLLYRNTNLDVADLELNHLRVVETSTEDSFYDVEVPGRFAELVTHYLPKPHAVPETTNGLILRIDHRKTQFSHLESRSPNDAADYRNGIITRMATVLPSVTGTELASSRLSIRSAGRKLLQLSETARSSKR